VEFNRAGGASGVKIEGLRDLGIHLLKVGDVILAQGSNLKAKSYEIDIMNFKVIN